MSIARVMALAALVGCAGRSGGGSPDQPTFEEPGTRAWPSIIESWADLQPRLRVYRGQLVGRLGDDGTYETCAGGLRAIVPPDATPPDELCTTDEAVLGKHGAHAWPAGHPDVWIGTSPSGHDERIAVALAVAPGAEHFGDAVGQALAEQYRCGQLALVWGRIPDADLVCEADHDCHLFTSMCFDAAVARAAAAPYREIHERWGGVCLDPTGGACPPSSARAACQQGRCQVAP
jgi:hypothetical protein